MASPLRSTGAAVPVHPATPTADPEVSAALAVLAGCRDLSSSSDEPYLRATSERQREHFHPGRANLLRALNVDAGWNVLELAPGYGSVTRYLGETCALVDAIEPDPARAQVTRARTADLARVEVFVGAIHCVPAERYYDLIVADSLLVDGDPAGVARSVELIGIAAARLAPGGVLVLGVDNKLGVRHLLGTSEVSMPRSIPAARFADRAATRGLSRAEIAEIFRRAGLHTHVLACFPDHRVPNVIFDPGRLPAAAPELVANVPIFPGNGSVEQPAGSDAADRSRTWRSIVNAGLVEEFANSFMVLASPTAGQALWESDLAGISFSPGRRSEFTRRTRIEVSGDKIMLRRDRINERPQCGDFRVEPHDSDFIAGTGFLDLLVDVDDERSLQYLNEWADMVRTCPSRQVPFDLIPQNLILGPDYRLSVVDDEWRSFDQTASKVLPRGVLLLGQALADRRPVVGQWQGCSTFRDLVTAIGTVVGLDREGWWIESAIADEARFQAAVSLSAHYPDGAIAEIRIAERFYAFLTADVQTDLISPGQRLRRWAAESARLRAESRQAKELATAAGELLLTAETRAATLQQRLTGTERELEAARQELLESRQSGQMARSDVLSAQAELLACQEQLRVCQLQLASQNESSGAGSPDGEWALAEVTRMRGTLSWRITAPLRWVRGAVAPRRRRSLTTPDRPAPG